MPKKAHKVKTKKINALSQRHKVFLECDPVIGVVSWGVNFSMMELAAVPPQPIIMDSDFKANSKVTINRSGVKDSVMPNKYTLKEYCPIVFRDLRERFGVTAEDYVTSICTEPAREIEVSKKSQAQTAKRMLFSTHDSEFLLQTLSRDEVERVMKSLPVYHSYIVEAHARTLLPHYLGLYRVSVEDRNKQTRDHYVMVMRSVQSYIPDMHRIYDLKGSTVSRDASAEEREKQVPMFKDNDFTTTERKLSLGREDREAFMEMLQRDADYLASHKLMDYSLMVGIRDDPSEPDLFRPGRDSYVFAPPLRDPESGPSAIGSVYLMGIVNVLTKYNLKKSAAHGAKTIIKKGGRVPKTDDVSGGGGITTVNPEHYRDRFVKFIGSILETGLGFEGSRTSPAHSPPPRASSPRQPEHATAVVAPPPVSNEPASPSSPNYPAVTSLTSL